MLGSASFLIRVAALDADVATGVKQAGCPLCGGRLDRADYPRKARGIPLGGDPELVASRTSFCCAEPECRKRMTPPSLRFFDRRVYLSLFVTLAAVLVNGVTPARVREVAKSLDVDRRTLERWRAWWTKQVPGSRVWQALRGYFAEPIDPGRLPASLLERYSGASEDDRLLRLLDALRDLSHSALMRARFAMPR